MKHGKHLRFYMYCMERGRMPKGGLCECAVFKLIDKELLEILYPSLEERAKLTFPGYWASDTEEYEKRWAIFSELRQTIVLFMAAMNDEL